MFFSPFAGLLHVGVGSDLDASGPLLGEGRDLDEFAWCQWR
jgi:hypothetical protein